ncbi:MAG: alpha,alpha-trehalase TreF [Pseudomonadota bacterium]|nr:alpha,alpha-trehalase TreF [Pseudomonadota bacterium]
MLNVTHTLRVVVLCSLALQGRAAAPALPANDLGSPAGLYGELFVRVQMERVFPDSKTFVDAIPDRPPAEVLRLYREAVARRNFDLRDFVAAHFEASLPAAGDYRIISGQDVRQHIDRLWDVLTREPGPQPAFSSRLPLPKRYVVPGGRFAEIYYWDSYFTLLGLEQSGRSDLVTAMIDNFSHLIEQYGHVPNGNRTYYLSRSQPPFFAAMVELEAARQGPEAYARRLPQLQREYAFWMEGAESLRANEAHRRVVRLAGGEILNRYWDDRDTPREESYAEDVATARASRRPAAEVYRHLRAAAESGWDFSSRWFEDGRTLATIHTTDIIPVDLNSLLYRLERTIESACRQARQVSCVQDMSARADMRKRAMLRYLWSGQSGAFTDYDWRTQARIERVSAATVYPLYFEVADEAQARTVARTVRDLLLRPHGIAATTAETGEQWDAPNGWAPLQWLAIEGLRRYGEHAVARTIAERWVKKNLEVFRATGKLVEKYNVSASAAGGGGEYPLQDGFGWTNGVLRRLLADYPELTED